MISITATREAVITYEEPNRHTWPLKVTVTAEGIEPEIFVYHTAVAGSAYAGDIFECVASVSQMQEIPKSVPAPGVPYYRLSTLTFACRSAEEAEQLWVNVLEDIQELVTNTNSLAAMAATETAVIT